MKIPESLHLEGDCLEILGRIPDHSIDLVVSDLPYMRTGAKWDTPVDLPRLWKQLYRVCKKDAAILMFADAKFAAVLINSNQKDFRYQYVWVKSHSTNFMNAKKMPMRKHELCLVFYRQLPCYNPQGIRAWNEETDPLFPTNDGKQYLGNTTRLGMDSKFQKSRKPDNDFQFGHGHKGVPEYYQPTHTGYPSDVLYFSGAIKRAEKLHNTQKPVPLLEYLIRTFSREGDVVLDPTCGSASTAVACVNTGRKYVAIERDHDYYEKGRRRLAGETKCEE